MTEEQLQGAIMRLEDRLQNEINSTNEQVRFLKDVIKKYCVSQLDDSMFENWKNKKGIFQ